MSIFFEKAIAYNKTKMEKIANPDLEYEKSRNKKLFFNGAIV